MPKHLGREAWTIPARQFFLVLQGPLPFRQVLLKTRHFAFIIFSYNKLILSEVKWAKLFIGTSCHASHKTNGLNFSKYIPTFLLKKMSSSIYTFFFFSFFFRLAMPAIGSLSGHTNSAKIGGVPPLMPISYCKNPNGPSAFMPTKKLP